MARTNLSPNPACKVNTTAWFGGSRTTSLSGTVRTTGYRSSGMGADTVIAAEGDGTPGLAHTVSIYVKPTATGANPNANVNIQFYAGGTFLGSSAGNVASLSTGSWTRLSETATAPAGTTRIRTTISTSGSGQIDLTGHLLEQSGSLGSYFDGDSTGGSWDGASGNSTSTLVDTQQLFTSSIPTGETFGTATVAPGGVTVSPTSIGTAESFGVALLEVGVIRPSSIGSDESFGVAALTGGVVTIFPVSIGSAEMFGAPTFTITVNAASRRARRRPSVTYELVVVARVTQPVGPPLLFEVDAIDWTGLSYSDELSKMQRIDAGCKVNRLSEPVRQRLRDPRDTELKLLRNGRPVFAGPLWGANIQGGGESVSLQAAGLLGYLRSWYVTADLVFTQVDQHAIATALIDHWQASEHGDYGIDTADIPPSGVLRDATYLRDEGHPIGQRVEELGTGQDGFDIAVDPGSRKLHLAYPWRGIDRSTGEDAIIFDARNVTSGDIIISAAPGDVASDAFGVGTGAGDRVYSTQSDLDLRAKYGRSGVFATFDGVSEQSTLDAHTRGLLDARAGTLLVPGPNLRVTPDADLSAYDVGDTVAYQLSSQLGIGGAFRIRKRTVTVNKTGEAVSVEFV